MKDSAAIQSGELGHEPQPEHSWPFFVIDTGGTTAEAIRVAGILARGLNAEMTLLVPIEVPFPVPLDDPPVALPFLQRRACELFLQGDMPGRVDLRLCRSRWETVRRALPPEAVVVLAGRWRWFGSGTRRLARRLAKDGHKVFLVEGDRLGQW